MVPRRLELRAGELARRVPEESEVVQMGHRQLKHFLSLFRQRASVLKIPEDASAIDRAVSVNVCPST